MTAEWNVRQVSSWGIWECGSGPQLVSDSKGLTHRQPLGLEVGRSDEGTRKDKWGHTHTLDQGHSRDVSPGKSDTTRGWQSERGRLPGRGNT